MNNVSVVYTPWANLKKTADMDVGQIGFHRQKDVSVARGSPQPPKADWNLAHPPGFPRCDWSRWRRR